MATKKHKSNISIEQNISLPNKTPSRALKIDSSGNLSESTVTETQLEAFPTDISAAQADADQAILDSAAAQATANAAIPATEKGAANGVATLDSNSKIPVAQLPAIAITDVVVVADITARDALTVGSGDGEIQEGDVVRVTDASADPDVTSGAASYIYDGSGYIRLNVDDQVLSVNGQVGVVVLDSGDLNHTQADAANWTVADGSSVEAHIDEVGERLVALEDNSANSGSATVTLVTNNVPVNITGLAFVTGTDLSAKVLIHSDSDAGRETLEFLVHDNNPGTGDYDMSIEAVGTDNLLTFDITAAGQITVASSDVLTAPEARLTWTLSKVN